MRRSNCSTKARSGYRTPLGTAGAACLEIGAGGGSIAIWLADLVGPSGRVVATDIDVRSLEAIDRSPSLEVRRHDVVQDPLEVGQFDLVHARLVLEHLPERDAVLTKLVRALRPGGWIVIEDVDYASAIPISELGASEHEHTQSVRLREFAKERDCALSGPRAAVPTAGRWTHRGRKTRVMSG